MSFVGNDILPIFSPPVVVPSWVDKTSSTLWTAPQGYWSTDHWQTGQPGQILLITNGAWASGFRPTKVKITFTGITFLDLYVKDFSGGQTIGSISLMSGIGYDISSWVWSTNMGRLDFQDTGYGSFGISKIEFQ